jgi:uncharacterized protein
VSAFLKHDGVNAKVLRGGKGQYQLYLSEDILEETNLVLLTYERIRKKYHYTDDEVLEYLETLSVVAKEVIKKLPKIRVIERDPKDDPILACALKVKADYIVSKDDHLKDLKEYRGIRIVSSQEFLELLK